MKNFAPYVVALVFGLLLGITLMPKCTETKYKIVNTVEYQFKDTLYITDTLTIPKPIVRWVNVTNFVHDTTYQHLLDTITEYYGYPEASDSFPVNEYKDSVSFMGVRSTDIGTTGTVRLKWTAQTQGYLVSLVPEITFVEDSIKTTIVTTVPKKSPWTLSVGLSNRLSGKVGIGYKGWSIEPTINFNKINPPFQVFLSKTFTINN
jgi:hypothetical protein